MEKLVLYGNGCSKCNILKDKLEAKGIEFEKSDDLSIIRKNGFLSVPILKVGDSFLMFPDANSYINSLPSNLL